MENNSQARLFRKEGRLLEGQLSPDKEYARIIAALNRTGILAIRPRPFGGILAAFSRII